MCISMCSCAYGVQYPQMLKGAQDPESGDRGSCEPHDMDAVTESQSLARAVHALHC